MKQRYKILLVCVCAVVLVAMSVLGTLAYLTDTDTAVNTMTVGNVDIKLDEADVDEQGKVESNERVTENKYHLLPGLTYIKDPTVTVLKDSEDCYVRMYVKVSDIEKLKAAMPIDDKEGDFKNFYNGDLFLLQYLCNGWDDQVWLYESYKNGVYEFRYANVVPKNENADTVLDALFDSITVPGAIDNTQLENLENIEITVTAQAIQAAGFKDADDAWDNF